MHPIVKFPFKLIFYYPGRIILWFRFMFPGKGQISRSTRQFREGGVALPFVFSCMFWIVAVLAVLFLIAAANSESEQEGEQDAAGQPATSLRVED